MAEEEAICVIVVIAAEMQGEVVYKVRRQMPRAHWLRVVVANGAEGRVRQEERWEDCKPGGCRGGRGEFVAGTSRP
jgi:hypothetical protein